MPTIKDIAKRMNLPSGKAVYLVDGFNPDNEDLVLNETIFHNANGYIGVRSCFEEGYPEGYATIRGSYINGFYDFVEMKQAEKLYGLVEEKQAILNVADTQTIRLSLDGEAFSMFGGFVLECSRLLDMDEGCTERRVLWRSPAGREAEITIRRMTSFTQISLFTIDYRVKSLNFDGEVMIESCHSGDVSNYSNPDDPRVARDSVKHLVPAGAELLGNSSFLLSRTANSGLEVCTGVRNVLMPQSSAASMYNRLDGLGSVCTVKTNIKKGEELRLLKYTVFCDSIRCSNCRISAEAELAKALSVPIEKHYEAQRLYLRDYWERSLLDIDGDDELNTAVRYNLYQLIQSVGKDSFGSIAAKGLSGEGYEGHYFWDAEMYIQPFFTLTNPLISRNFIEYRYRTLDEARKNARMMGHNKGALYPWRTITGSECSGFFPSGAAQYHINGDIAYSIVAYYLATGDFDFIADKGAEIVFETARLWIDTGNYYKGRFRINEVTGPDEYTCMVNNNYYTNACAQYNLQWAVKFYRMLEESGRLAYVAGKTGITPEEVAEFEKAAQCMYLPYDEELKINPQDDSFLSKKKWDLSSTPKEKFPLLLHYHPMYLYRHQVCKQADTVLAHFVFEDAQSLETIRNSFEYYESITTHDSSLSSCIFSIVASKLGLSEKAYRYFGDSAKLDLFDTHRNTKYGIHTANMGGTYMTIVYGFGGLRLKKTGISFAPTLPSAWTGYRFRIFYRNSRIGVEVKKGGSIFALLGGSPQDIYVYGKKYTLKDRLVIANETRNKGGF